MKKYTTAEDAIRLVIDILEANHLVSDTENIRKRVYSWYNHSDVADSEMLAACAMTGKDWFPGATYEYMIEVKNYWFPPIPYEEIAIWEIEAAQHDSMWW